MKLTSVIRRAPKRFAAIVAMVAAAIIVPTVVLAWGPNDRATFTIENPADYITFNSITNNPVYGDERNFMRVREATASNETYTDNINLAAGKEYTILMYYHNNAASNLNLVALNTTARAELPAVVENGSTGTKANGFISSSNANPGQVWDEVAFSNTTGGDIALRFVPGSAHIYNFGDTNGMSLPDSIITTGATLGYDELDGKVPGCNEFSGYVTFKIKADQPNFEVNKQVRLSGTSAWSETVAAQTNSTADYMIEYKNTGSTQQNDVIVRDVMPQGVDYVPGSTYLMNSNNPNGKLISDNLVSEAGVNIGSYAPGSNAFLKFTVKVDKEELACGNNSLKNVATVYTKNGAKSDDAYITVKKHCEQPKEIKVCDLKTHQIVTIDEKDFDSNKYSKDLSDCEKIKVCDLETKQIVHIYPNDFDSSKYSKNLDDCKEEPKKIKVCDLETKQIVYINENDFDSSKYSKDLDDCKEKPKKIVVCDLTTKKIVTIKENDFDASKYSKNLDDCKEEGEITVCVIETKDVIVIKESEFDSSKHSTDLSDCETPVTPPELPTTGPTETVVAIVGLGALIAAISYYVASRRALV